MSEFEDTFFDTAAAEKLSTGERLKLARKKRAQQLKKYVQFEKQLEKESGRKVKKSAAAAAPRRPGKVHFGENIVLLEAASRNDIEEVRSLLSSGVDPNVGNEDGLTALHQCCIDNLEEMLHLLVDFGASVNSCDSELWTPLHAAATCGHAHLCRYLVERGADLLSVNGDGNMPFDICDHECALDFLEAEMSKRGVTQDLINETRHIPEQKMLADLRVRLENGSSLEFHGRHGETPLHVAATNGFVEVAQFLFDHRVSVSVTDNDLWQPIHCAAFWCQLPLVELLLQHGATFDALTRCGESPLDICDDAETKKRLLELKKEFEGSCRSFKSRGALSRQRSSSIRRGSVRRSSMKEKKALSLKAAREEGRWLQDAAMQNNNDEDDVAAAGNDVVTETTSNNSNNNRVPGRHLPSENSPDDSTKSHPPPPLPPPDDNNHPTPSRKPPPQRSGARSGGIRKGSRSLQAKDDATDPDPLPLPSEEEEEERGERRPEMTTLLIKDVDDDDDDRVEKCNGGSKEAEAGLQFNTTGVMRGQRGCCSGQCCLLQ